MNRFEYSSEMPATAAEVYRWHAQDGALARLTPPWERMEIEGRVTGIRSGSRVHLRLGRGPLRLQWIAEHEGVVPDSEFVDIQAKGPFKFWRHRHRFEEGTGSLSVLRDEIEYELPWGALGQAIGGRYVRRSLERTFEYRHQTTGADMELHERYADHPSLTVAITGAGGLIGSALTAMLTTGGHRVIKLVRSPTNGHGYGVLWDPSRGILEPEKLAGIDAVVHLAGESIAQGRWTERKKERILTSRVAGTSTLIRSLLDMENPPQTLISASAIGIYGDRGDEVLNEASATGTEGFLADVCRQWEEATRDAEAGGVRVVTARTGIVLSPAGGALAKMLPAFKLGAGGRLGSGEQYMSWISIDDAAGALLHMLMRPELRGPVNLVSPNPVRNLEFTRELGSVLRRPALIPMPAFAVRLLFGQMADEALLASTRVLPVQLEESEYRFRDPDLGPALRRLLGR